MHNIRHVKYLEGFQLRYQILYLIAVGFVYFNFIHASAKDLNEEFEGCHNE